MHKQCIEYKRCYTVTAVLDTHLYGFPAFQHIHPLRLVRHVLLPDVQRRHGLLKCCPLVMNVEALDITDLADLERVFFFSNAPECRQVREAKADDLTGDVKSVT